MKKIILITIILALVAFPKVALAYTQPIVGAIRFDDWATDLNIKEYVGYRYFGPQQWHYRLPFYTSTDASGNFIFSGNDQSTMDKEIAFANAAGISYFAFDYYPWLVHTENQTGKLSFTYGLRRYLTSSQKNELKFTLIVVFGGSAGSTANWATEQAPAIADLTKDPNYQTLAGGRPLVYFFGINTFITEIGSKATAKTEIDTLRQQITAATGKNPYFVVFSASAPGDAVPFFGFDATSEYVHPGTNGLPKGATSAQLAVNDALDWNQHLTAGYQFIPQVSTGWDPRPEIPYNPAVVDWGWYQKSTPDDIATELQSAMTWLTAHPTISAPNSILMNAWDEIIEGGFLVPTLFDGDSRLQAIAKVLKGTNFSSPRYKGRDINGDGKIDIFDYKQLVGDFGKNLDPIPNNSDITGDGKVDIFDYNQLVANFGK